MADVIAGGAEGAVRFKDMGDGTFAPVEAIEAGGSGNLNVQRTSAGFMAVGQTSKQYTGYATLSASPTTIALETVTNGATFYITDISIVSDYANASGNLDVQIQAAGTAIFRSSIHNLSPVEMPGMETQPYATTGQAVTLNIAAASTSNHVWYWISGFEQ